MLAPRVGSPACVEIVMPHLMNKWGIYCSRLPVVLSSLERPGFLHLHRNVQNGGVGLRWKGIGL